LNLDRPNDPKGPKGMARPAAKAGTPRRNR
jgi:hypothetical protein